MTNQNPQEQVKIEETKKVKKNKKRCLICNKKLGLIDYSCRCGNFYCQKHRLPELHSCSFDYQKSGKELLDKNNPTIVADKVIKF